MSTNVISVSQTSISNKAIPSILPEEEFEEVSPVEFATKILNGYEKIVNSRMILVGGGRHRMSIVPSKYQAVLTLDQDEKVFTYTPDDVKTETLRIEKINFLANSIKGFGIGTFILKIDLPANTLNFKPLKVGSSSSLFNKDELRFEFKESDSVQTIIIENPVNLYTPMSCF